MTFRVLDPACGPRMWWFDPANPAALFGDRRKEVLVVTDRSHGKQDGARRVAILPAVLMDFRALPFADAAFRIVAFDPPHIARAGPKSWMAAKYGKLGDDWREDLAAGFRECFRVLLPAGVLVFKWNEAHVKLREVLACAPQAPLFGNTAGRKAGTHFMIFLKEPR